MRIFSLLLLSGFLAPRLCAAQTPPTLPAAPDTAPTAPLPAPVAAPTAVPTPVATPQVAATPTPAPKPALKGRLIVPTGAVSFTSKAQGFAVWLPGKPAETKRTTLMPTGENAVSSAFQVEMPSSAYSVDFSRFPTKFAALAASYPGAQAKLLDGGQFGAISSLDDRHLGPRLQKQEDLHLGNFPGRELKISFLKGTAVLRTRFFLTPQGIYALSVTGPKAEMEKQVAQVQRFFDSLRILPQK